MKSYKQMKNRLIFYCFFIELARLMRRKFIKLLRSLPNSLEILDLPKGFYNSTLDWMLKYNLSKISLPKASYSEIYPSHQISRLEPKTLERSIHWKFKQEYQRESPAAFVATVPYGRVWGRGGTVITADGMVLGDVSRELSKNPDEHSINLQLWLPSVRYIEGKVAVLSTAGSEHYFHWMFDTLPRIDLLRQSNICIDSIDKFVICSYYLPFHIETLNTLGIPLTKVIKLGNYLHIKATQLVVPSLPGNTGNMPYWVCEFLRKEFLHTEIVEKYRILERIYLSRKNAKYRKIVNEDELINFLSKLGFTNVLLESMSVAEQALLFSSAKVVVAPHGAGLTNIVFCKTGTKIVELFSPGYVNVCYWSLCNQIDLEYYYLIGEGLRFPEGVDPHQCKADIVININSIASLMKLARVM